jgi:hypothetical protein
MRATKKSQHIPSKIISEWWLAHGFEWAREPAQNLKALKSKSEKKWGDRIKG